MHDVTAEATKAASALAGRPVTYHHEAPDDPNLLGECYLKNGHAHIKVNPGLADSKWLHVFLHETAHALHHADNYVDQASSMAQWYKMPDTEYTRQRKRLHELEAEVQALQWLEWLQKHLSDQDTRYKLWALAFYRTLTNGA